MAENHPPHNVDPHYEETTAPENPPYVMVGPKARNVWWASSFGVLVLLFLIIGAAFTWVLVQREVGEGSQAPQAVGTSGERQSQDPTPGPAADITQPGDVAGAPVGARVSLANVVVDRTDGGAFWIRAGEAMIPVTAPGGTPTVRAGQHVNVSGTIETAGSTKQIRASRIDVK
jgi:hypothetical protein